MQTYGANKNQNPNSGTDHAMFLIETYLSFSDLDGLGASQGVKFLKIFTSKESIINQQVRITI